MIKIRCTFRPQAWINDYACDVDVPEDANTTWEMEVEELPPPHSYESDELRHCDDAPDWVADWSGPFEVDFEVIS